MPYDMIISAEDELLVVFIDRADPKAQVFYAYDGQAADQSTPYRTADMPMDDQAAARMVNAWIE